MITITKEFITEEEEKQILAYLKPSRVSKADGTRNTIKRYGSTLPYNTAVKSKELPEWVDFIVSRLMAKKFLTDKPDHVTINEYHKGQFIDWHIDSKGSGPVITVLSLLSDATMGLKDDKGQEVQHFLPVRSLLQLTDKERWNYKHCIFPVEGLRFSIVFRKGTK
jgi:alkylated DNA repair dioxygenase AlkB